jgi:hypothetical protein
MYPEARSVGKEFYSKLREYFFLLLGEGQAIYDMQLMERLLGDQTGR